MTSRGTGIGLISGVAAFLLVLAPNARLRSTRVRVGKPKSIVETG